MSNDGLGEPTSTSPVNDPVTVTVQHEHELQRDHDANEQQQHQEDKEQAVDTNKSTYTEGDDNAHGTTSPEVSDSAVQPQQQQQEHVELGNGEHGDHDSPASSSAIAQAQPHISAPSATEDDSVTSPIPPSHDEEAQEPVTSTEASGPDHALTSSSTQDTVNAASSPPLQPQMSSTSSYFDASGPPTPSVDSEQGYSETASNNAAASAASTNNVGQNTSTAASSSIKAPAPMKKFMSSLSMNKKFLEKAGASDAKSPQPAHAIIPKSASPAARSPALASPGIPAHPGTSASPPINASTSAPASHPRLLTGKLSNLASGSGSGSTPPPSSATWGRTGLATGNVPGAAGNTAFGKTGFVPAAPVPGGPGSGPGFGPGSGPPALGRMRAFGVGGRPTQAPWAGAGRGGGFNRGGNLDQEFPSFQEAAKAEEKRQHAILAKERAEKMAAAAQAAYNQRVLEGLKGFSGEYTSSTTHWDEIDDDDDDLGDVLEFADGTRYEVPQSATLPTEAETAAFEQAAKAEEEAAALEAEYKERLLSEQQQQQEGKSTDTSGGPSLGHKSERFIDDFDRGEKRRALEEQAQSAGRQQVSGRTLFNDRLGRFEPYAGRGQQPPPAKRERRTSPPAVLQRPSRGSVTSPQEQSRPHQQQRLPSGSRAAAPPARNPGNPLSPVGVARAQPSSHEAKVETPQQQKRVESPWAKLPPVAVESIPVQGTAAASKQHAPSSTPQIAQALPTSTPATTIPSAPSQTVTPAAPTVPVEDPEEAYKREMRAIADQARKRRQDEEAEREAQKERARKKAQEIEEKMKLTQKTVAAASAATKAAPTAILSPPTSKSDHQPSWRRPSIDIKFSQGVPAQRTLLQSQPQAGEITSGPISARTNQSRIDKKPVPSSEDFDALAKTAAASWRSIGNKDAARASNVDPEPVVQKQDSVLPDIQPSSVDKIQHRQSRSSSSHVDESAQQPYPPTLAPRVRLGNRTPSQEVDQSALTAGHGTFGVPQAFPQPTILTGRGHANHDGLSGPQPVSAIEKIMSQVRAAQDDLKTRQMAAALLEEEKRKWHGSSKKDFDGALSRITRALGEASLGSTAQPQNMPLMQVRYVPEVFDQTSIERPQSPRIWKTFTVKIPTGKLRDAPHIPNYRLRAFEDANLPPPIYSSSWIPPRGVRMPRNTTLEDFLFGKPDPSEVPKVKFSKFYPASAIDHEPAEITPEASTSASIRPGFKTSDKEGESSGASPAATYESLPLVDFAPVTGDDEEDIATMPFDEERSEPAEIRVSLPKKTHSSTIVNKPEASNAKDISSHEAGRFRTYGPKLPENSTVAFRRGISPSKAIDTSQPSSGHMFMVNSELNGSTEEAYPSFMRSYDQQVIDEVSSSSKTFAAAPSREQAPKSDLRPSPTYEPVFPSLSSASERMSDANDTNLGNMRRDELPRHVIAELERLNATVSSAPLTNASRLDSPASLLGARSTSPWAVSNKASIVPSALSLSAIDPSMSVWSKPTEETASAAAAAFNSASKDAANDSVQENSLKDLIDDYPSSMPSNAMDLPISDSERPQSKGSEHYQQRHSPARSRSQDRSPYAMSISQVIGNSPNPPSMPLSGRDRIAGHEGYPTYAVGTSPFPASAQLPYSATQASLPSQNLYSQQYGAYGYAQTNGMPYMQPTYPSSPAYSAMPIPMTSQNSRGVSSHNGSGSFWMPSAAPPGSLMDGSFSSGAHAYGPGSMSANTANYSQMSKARVHSSPMYQRRSPIGAELHQVYSPYSAGPSSAASNQYTSYTSQTRSPATQAGYMAQSQNGSMNHLRSTSAHQHGRRPNW